MNRVRHIVIAGVFCTTAAATLAAQAPATPPPKLGQQG